MIRLEKPYIENKNDKSRLCCKIIENDKREYLAWFEVDKQYEKYLCVEKLDGFVVNLLLYCMENQHDIICECPISEKLYFQLTRLLIPSISKNLNKYNSISIKADLSNEKLESAYKVGTGFSGGVDSFYTICSNLNKNTKDFNLTHLTFFNAGASGSFGGEQSRKLYEERLNQMSKNISIFDNLPLLPVDTNINEFLNEDHEQTHTFRSLSIPLVLQKLFSVYYYSSGVEFSEFSFIEEDTAYYDILTLSCLSTENISFYSIGGEASRIEKLEYISSFDYVPKVLDVCVKDKINCGVCEKCVRTQMGLYSINKLGLYQDSFNLDIFNSRLKQNIAYVLFKKKNNEFYNEIYENMKRNSIKIPFSSVLLSKWYYIVRKIKDNKLVRKIYLIIFSSK